MARHLAQLEETLQRRQVWSIWVLVVLLERAYPRGQIMQFLVWEHVTLAIQVVPDRLYPCRQERQEEELVEEHVAHGIWHYCWHCKFWFKKYPSTQEEQPSSEHYVHFKEHNEERTHTLEVKI